MSFFRNTNRYIIFLGVFVFVFSFSSVKADLPAELVGKVIPKVEIILDEVINELITEEKVCQELWITYPAKQPEKSLQDVERDIEKQATIALKKNIPSIARETYHKKAQERYRPFQISERIQIQLKNGKIIQGYFREQDSFTLLVDNQVIDIRDIIEEDLAHFDEYTRKVKTQEYIRNKITETQAKRYNFEMDFKKKIASYLYTDAGYIMVSGVWISQYQCVYDRLQEEREKIRSVLKPLLEYKLYAEEGFAFFHDKWMTKEKADKEREHLKEEKHALEEGNSILDKEVEGEDE